MYCFRRFYHFKRFNKNYTGNVIDAESFNKYSRHCSEFD